MIVRIIAFLSASLRHSSSDVGNDASVSTSSASLNASYACAIASCAASRLRAATAELCVALARSSSPDAHGAVPPP
jgi:hypothetical protein